MAKIIDGAAGVTTAEAEHSWLRGIYKRLAVALVPARVVMFVLLFAWYLFTVVDMRLVFLERDKLFLLNSCFLREFLVIPGALLEWVDRLLVQLCYYGWPASLAFAAVLWVLLVSTIGLMRAAGRLRVVGTWLVPGILILVLQSDYKFQTSTVVGLALAVVLANAWVRVSVRWMRSRMALFVLISAFLYYVAGGAAYGVFALCCVIREMLAERRWLLGMLLVVAAVSVKFGVDAALSCITTVHSDAPAFFLDLTPTVFQSWRAILLYLYFPVCEVVVICLKTVKIPPLSLLERSLVREEGRSSPRGMKKPNERELKDDNRSEHAQFSVLHLKWITWVAGSVFMLSAASAAGYFAIERGAKISLGIDYCAEHQLWDGVLERAGKLPVGLASPRATYDINLALYHKNRLNEMFSYPQIYSPPIFGAVRDEPALLRKKCDLLTQLGRVNEAEHIAHEMLESFPSGGVLRQLALLKMIKGQTDAARTVLHVMQGDLVWKDWATEYLQCIARDRTLSEDKGIQWIRSLMLVQDDLSLTAKDTGDGQFSCSIVELLTGLLKRNRMNLMAFDYLIVHSLQTRYVESVAFDLDYLEKRPDTSARPLCEEAALICGLKQKAKITDNGSVVFLNGRSISKTTSLKWRRFQEIVRPYGGPTRGARAAVAEELKDSYFYYYCYGSGSF